MKCSGCLKIITKEDYVVCTSKFCSRTLHTNCSNARNLTSQQKEVWVCPDCQASTRKSGDNANTPIRSNENVTHRKKTIATTCQDTQSSPNHEVIAEIRSLRQDMINMQSDLNKRFDDLLSRFGECEARIKSLEQKEKKNDQLKAQVAQLQSQLNKQTHNALRSEIEILGLTETPRENPYHLALMTANKIGLKLEEHDLDYVSRTGTLNNGKPGGMQLPRPLVVSFTRRSKRDELLKEAKTRRNLDSQEIVGPGPQRRVFVNERLTYETRHLFRVARNWTREHGYKFCWVRNGSVYIRKREGREGSPPIAIQDIRDLEKLSGIHSANEAKEDHH
ncbi:unnamed protein product [Diatraea saccharalis]|uniref:Zinc finger PHD-type domain-containing protein n=1 Tax=Diatraea saccharalis TaxID=40085 RepID=A0A9N9WL51_9NEOP|nr:unnamed protein product [Diatraea saccharalis]